MLVIYETNKVINLCLKVLNSFGEKWILRLSLVPVVPNAANKIKNVYGSKLQKILSFLKHKNDFKI